MSDTKNDIDTEKLKHHLGAANKLRPKLEAHFKHIDSYKEYTQDVVDYTRSLSDLLINEDTHNGKYVISGTYEGLNDNKPIENEEESFKKLFTRENIDLYNELVTGGVLFYGLILESYSHLLKAEECLYKYCFSVLEYSSLRRLYIHNNRLTLHHNLEVYAQDIHSTLVRSEESGMDTFIRNLDSVNNHASVITKI